MLNKRNCLKSIFSRKYRQAEQQQVARNGRVAMSEAKQQNQKNREREYPILLV